MDRISFIVCLGLVSVGLLVGCAIRRGVVHEVKRGQTLWRISQVYNVKLNTLMDVNDIENANAVEAGSRIVIPGHAETREVPLEPQERLARANGNLSSDATGSSSGAGSTTTGSGSDRISPTDPPAGATSDDSASSESGGSGDRSVYFDPVWPCEGRLASRFDKNAGPTKRGIRIHTTKGSTVKSADEGNIKLAGEWEKMPDLGKIVIIFHSNDFTTVYAHLKSVKVSEGTKIERGQPIGTVGHSGDVSQPMCYFEIRYKLEPRDPLIFLGEPS